MAKGVIKGERGIYVIPYCDRLPGDELSHTECLDKFQPIGVLDVSGVVAAKGVTKRDRGFHVSPPCDRPPGDELSHRECLYKFQPLDDSGV